MRSKIAENILNETSEETKLKAKLYAEEILQPKMKQTIFNTYVLMQSQSDCDEAKAICEEYGLPMWENKMAFEYYSFVSNYLASNLLHKQFAIWDENKNKPKSPSPALKSYVRNGKRITLKNK